MTNKNKNRTGKKKLMAKINDYATAFMIYDSEARDLIEETCIAADGLPLFYEDAGGDEHGKYLRYAKVYKCAGWINGLPISLIIQRKIYRNYCYIQKINGYTGIYPCAYPCYEYIGACKIKDAINEFFKCAEKQLREKRPEKFKSDEPSSFVLLSYIEEKLS